MIKLPIVGGEVPENLKKWYTRDRDHSAKWRQEAKEDFDFVAGRQWDQDALKLLNDQGRPVITYNYIGAYVDTVSGLESSNKQEVRYIPRELGDVEANEVLTSAGEWFNDEADMSKAESDMFMNTIICGMGWTEDRLDFDDNPNGTPYSEERDPLAMVWDYRARQSNLKDSKRVWYVQDEIPIEEARLMFPGFDDDALNASWASLKASMRPPHVNDGFIHLDRGLTQKGNVHSVTIVQCQIKMQEEYYRVISPYDQTEDDWSVEQWDLAQQMGLPVYGTRHKRTVVKQMFLGSQVLAVGDGPSKDKFSFRCMTGKRDTVRNLFLGIVRAMKDPQSWTNKWRSQILHILNSQAKGGIMAERGAFEDERAAEKSWAAAERITWMEDGSLSNSNGPRVQPKPMAQIPAGHEALMAESEGAIRKVANIPLELIGMADVNQPGILEHQRKQAGMTNLQYLFDNLNAYRKGKGQLILEYIQRYLSDGRLIRIVGDDKARYVPLVKQASEEYDVIIDDAPTSPNQKERTWFLIQDLMPQVREMLTPAIMLEILQYSPLPKSLLEKLREQMEAGAGEAGQSQAMQQAMQQLLMQMQAAEARKTEAEAGAAEAKATGEMADAMKARADTLKSRADAEYTMVETQRLIEAPPEPQANVAP